MKEISRKEAAQTNIMKKQSILNLVNSILLLCSLLFSVISFAWYSPNKDVGTPLSFGACGAGGMVVDMLTINDITKENTTLTVTKKTVSDLSTNTSLVDASTLLEFGAIHDLGYLKNSNCVYYCVTIKKSEVGELVQVNLGYLDVYKNTNPVSYCVSADGNAPSGATSTGYHFVLNEINGDLSSFYEDVENLESFPTEIANWKSAQTFIHYACKGSNVSPATISATDLLAMFPTTGNAMDNAIPVSEKGTAATDQLTSVDLSEFSEDVCYVYIKVTPDLDNYAELAQLLMGHMPFYMGFGLRLHAQAQPKSSAVAE